MLHPDDTTQMIAFRDYVLAGKCGNETMLMRLKTVSGDYHWYRMSICISCPHGQIGATVVGTFTDAHEETCLREAQRKLALHDEVTGIYNKQAFYDATKRLLERNTERRYSLVLFDVNRFKMINELFGISEGDRLLRFIGDAAKACVADHETYGRIRDDVFCLCVCRSDAEILLLVDELRATVSESPLPFGLTLSIGVYGIDDRSLPTSIMVDRASLALRTVKDSAVDSCAFYRPELGQTLTREQKILGEMQAGIRTGQFKVYYQPKHNTGDGRIIGAEALVRWIHPERGLIPPVEFIELFERNGLITQLDEYVWETVCQDLRRWLDMGLSPQAVSVNVSRVDLYAPNLCEKLIHLTEKYDLPPSLLEIELTESAYVENPQLGELMEELHSKGFIFLMDDFGSGYSSLNMLRSIPVDMLKLDLHFLDFTEQDPAGRIIMESVIQMAHKLNILVLAEGVETAGQVAFLREAHCTMAQGFFYSKPMPRAEYELKYL